MKLTKGKISKAIRKKKQSMKKYKRKNVKNSGHGKAKTFRKRKGTNLLKSTLKNYGLIGGTPGDLFETQDGPLLGNYTNLRLTPEKVKGNPKFKFIEAYDGKKADITSDAATKYMQDNQFVDPNIASEIEMKDMSKKSGPESGVVPGPESGVVPGPESGVVPGPEAENQDMNFVDSSVLTENNTELNDVSLEDDNSVLQEEIANLKQQIVQLQKQAKKGSSVSTGSASDTSSFGLSEGQIDALAGMEGFQPSNMVAFLKTFMILIATIIKLNDSNAGGNGDLKQAMSILASGLKPETVDSLGGVVDSAGDTSAASVNPSVASSSSDSAEPDNSNQPNSAGDEVIRLTEEISNKESEFKERLDAFNSAEQAIENMSDTDPDYTDLKNQLEEARLELSKLSKETIQFVTDQQDNIVKIFAAAEGLDLPENQKIVEDLEEGENDIANLSQVVESKDPSFLQKQENEASEIAAEIKSNSSNLKDSVLQNGANVVSGLLQLAALGLHGLYSTFIPNETKSNSVPQVQPDIQPQVQPDPELLTAPVPDPSESMQGGKEKKNKKRKSKTKKTNKKSKESKKNNSKKNKSK